MARRTRRNHAAGFKAKVALDAIRGELTLAQLSQKYDVHPNQIADWRSQMLERAASVFGADVPAHTLAIDLKALHAKIGQLTLENDCQSANSLIICANMAINAQPLEKVKLAIQAHHRPIPA